MVKTEAEFPRASPVAPPPPIFDRHTDWSKRERLKLGHQSHLQVVEDEKQCFCGQSLVELDGVRVVRWYLMMEGQGGAGVPHQVLP